MTKIRKLAVAVAIASVSTLASAGLPPEAPTMYGTGPAAGNVASTNLSAQERAAYALLESMMQVAEAKIHATGCTPVELKLSVFSGANPAPLTEGTATLGLGSTAVKLKAVADAAPTYQGQKFNVTTTQAGEINGTPVGGYTGSHTYNAANNMMVGTMTLVTAVSVNGVPNQFQGSIIKDFYMGAAGAADAHIVFDWGLQALLKGNFPVEKYWQRSKVRRSDGGNGQTAFVKDRLVGPSSCRIAIFMDGTNAPLSNSFSQSGLLKIQAVAPAAAASELSDVIDI